jgi:hypothetical protein
LTPSLWLWLSRPLRLWAAPFLCAICCLLFLLAPRSFHRFDIFRSRWQYFIDIETGEKLTVAILPAITYLGLVLENDYFIALAVLLDRRYHPGPVDQWLTDRDLISIGNEEYSVQFDITTFSRIQTFDVDNLSFGYLILFAARFNNSVNFRPPNYLFYQF